jgi:Fic family protein
MNNILKRLQDEMNARLKGGLYHYTQVAMAYNSNRIEGNQLTHDQTRHIYETHSILMEKDSTVKTDDIIETLNHFAAFDFMLKTAAEVLSEKIIKHYHLLLKQGTSQSKLDWFNVGKYKKLPNTIGEPETTPPKSVAKEIRALLAGYNALKKHTVKDIVKFHFEFEKIHPFQDGNGRAGRLIIFKECLTHNIVPFIIDSEHRLFYYRGLQQYSGIPKYLNDTCLSAQDHYSEVCKKFKAIL